MAQENWQSLLQRAGSAHKLARLAEAETLYRAVLLKHPQQPDALYLLGMLLAGGGRPDEALELLRRAIAADPRRVAPLCGLSSTLIRIGLHEDAVAVARDAVTIDPKSAHAHYQLGQALHVSGDLASAVPCYLRATDLDKRFFEAYMNAGVALKELGLVGDAITCQRAALALRPKSPLVLANLGNAEKDSGRVEEAVRHYRRALEVTPENAEVHSNLVYALHYLPTSDSELLAAHRTWDERHGAPRLSAIHRPERGDPEAGRRLRVGYVSPDFRAHSVAAFIEPVLTAHREVEAFCYSDVARPDEVTARMRACVGQGWRDIHGLDDEGVAGKIRADRIDVLVDLAGHTARHRLRVFARRPAPIQLSWIGYPGTTGLAAIQYRITDERADPPGASDEAHTEHLIRLPSTFLCYRPLDDAPPVEPPPSETAGFVTFGSFNQLPKMTPQVVAVWARILVATPGSRLGLKARGLHDPMVLADVRARFAAAGVDPQRLQLSGHIDGQRAHLAAYGKVDIALDPFPYNGTTTTCEALWMGVPVVALAGGRHAARVGVSLLAQVGLPLCADSVDAYVAAAVELAKDPARLRELRRSLRESMGKSPLTDARTFVAGLEAAYTELWRNWCARNPERKASAG